MYVAPEILAHHPYDKKVDMWSIGIIAYLMLTGKFPFDDLKEQEIVRQILFKPINWDDGRWDEVSVEGKEFVKSKFSLLTQDC
jgi:calcium/calmodulin-dependent protein kinase I